LHLDVILQKNQLQVVGASINVSQFTLEQRCRIALVLGDVLVGDRDDDVASARISAILSLAPAEKRNGTSPCPPTVRTPL
jgi:hypothetical protein